MSELDGSEPFEASSRDGNDVVEKYEALVDAKHTQGEV